MEERNNQWLKNRSQNIIKRYFSDIEIKNSLITKFGRPCNTRLGSIKPSKLGSDKYSIITINGHFQDIEIPEFVIDAVIAHEFMHYAHGFASPHKQAYKHPHKGGVVDWDLKERGLGDVLKLEKQWIKKHWKDYLTSHGCLKPRARRKRYIRFKLFG